MGNYGYRTSDEAILSRSPKEKSYLNRKPNMRTFSSQRRSRKRTRKRKILIRRNWDYGDEFNAKYPKQEFYKLTNRMCYHNGFQYHEGLNIDLQRINGSLYFAKKKNFMKWYNINTYYIWKVTIPKDAKVYYTDECDNFKADRIHLSDCKKIGDSELWYDTDFCINSMKINKLLYRYVPNCLWRDSYFCLAVIKSIRNMNSYIITKMRPQFENDRNLCNRAFKINKSICRYIPIKYQTTAMRRERKCARERERKYERSRAHIYRNIRGCERVSARLHKRSHLCSHASYLSTYKSLERKLELERERERKLALELELEGRIRERERSHSPLERKLLTGSDRFGD